MDRAKRAALRIGIVAFCTLVAVFVRLFIVPAQQVPNEADAVVVFAGGAQNVRIGRAVELMDLGIAPTLVVSVGDQIWSKGSLVETLCRDGSTAFDVICVAPDPDSTIGEAASFASIAEESGWTDIVAVTSVNHLHRASLWLSRCFDGRVWSVAATDRSLDAIGHEALGTGHALLLNRTCPADHDGRITRR